ncbi:hypothetical protein V500_05694 [Pseudogymnoascus sp. VKM F-4518 (FW-2643)]|nr:hypothetical protein V500_05694 [Pseudogymnoascus sp. VKM F-4518 (FW-2643)]
MQFHLATIFLLVPVFLAAPLPSPQVGEIAPPPVIAPLITIVNGLPSIGGQVVHGFTSIITTPIIYSKLSDNMQLHLAMIFLIVPAGLAAALPSPQDGQPLIPGLLGVVISDLDGLTDAQ